MKSYRYAEIDDAICMIIEGFTTGVFVRSTKDDSKPDWAIGFLPYASALAILKEHADKVQER